VAASGLAARCLSEIEGSLPALEGRSAPRDEKRMANTKSAKKATRKIARRTKVNQARRSRMRNFLRRVEEAIAAGDKARALSAFGEAEPEIMRAAQKGVVAKNAASRKVSRLSHRIAKLGA
jgi:small subunit ribosomal protein S20